MAGIIRKNGRTSRFLAKQQRCARCGGILQKNPGEVATVAGTLMGGALLGETFANAMTPLECGRCGAAGFKAKPLSLGTAKKVRSVSIVLLAVALGVVLSIAGAALLR